MLIYSRKFTIKIKHAIIIVSVTLVIGYGLIYLLSYLESLVLGYRINNIIRGFALFPVIAYVPSKLLKENSLKVFDVLAPTILLAHAILNIGCVFAGCCRGYPSYSFLAIYNSFYKDYFFPTQLLVTVCALVLFILCIIYSKHEHFSGSGRVYPLFLIVFGCIRFCTDLLTDNKKILYNSSVLSIYALLMVIVGVIWMIWLKNNRPKNKLTKNKK